MIEIFYNPIYRVLWTSLFIYIISTSISMLAILDIMHTIYNKEIAVSYWYSLSNIAPIIMTYFTSIIIDKYNQRKVYFLSVLPITTLTSLYIVAYYYNMIWLFYTISFITYSLMSLSEPALVAYMSTVINKEDLIHANSVVSITTNGCNILMQGLAGLLVSWLGPVKSIIISVVLELICLAIESSLIFYPKYSQIYTDNINKSNNDEDNTDTNNETNNELFMNGIKYMLNDKITFNLTLIKAIANLGIGVVYNLNFYYAYFTLTQFNKPELTYAIVSIPTAIFGIVFTYGVNKYVSNSDQRMLFICIVCSVMIVVGISLYFFVQNIYMWIVADCLAMAPHFALYDMVTTIIQKNVPHKYQGRVASIGYNLRCMTTGITIILTGIFITYYSEYYIWYKLAVIVTSSICIPISVYTYKRNCYENNDSNIGRDGELIVPLLEI